MPFALIPDGFTIQKVTAAQERAVKSKRRQDDLIALGIIRTAGIIDAETETRIRELIPGI
jgi:hypothetical protein